MASVNSTSSATCKREGCEKPVFEICRVHDGLCADCKDVKQDTCFVCGMKATQEDDLIHGEVYASAFDLKPRMADVPYCDPCSDCFYESFQYCSSCDREMLFDDDNFPTGQFVCALCLIRRREGSTSNCKVCGGPANGYFTDTHCRDCEEGAAVRELDRSANEKRRIKVLPQIVELWRAGDDEWSRGRSYYASQTVCASNDLEKYIDQEFECGNCNGHRTDVVENDPWTIRCCDCGHKHPLG